MAGFEQEPQHAEPTPEDEVAARIIEWRRALSLSDHKWRAEAKDNYRMRDGSGISGEEGQWDRQDLLVMADERRVAPEFNRIAPMLAAIQGAEVKDRKEARYYPRKMEDVKKVELVNSAAEFVRDESNAQDADSEAFSDMLTCGLGVTETFPDEESTGRIRIERVDPLEIRTFGAELSKNLRGVKVIERKKRVTRDAAINVLGFDPCYSDDGKYNPTFHISRPQDDYDSEGQDFGDDLDDNLVTLCEYQWYEIVRTVAVTDPRDGSEIEVDETTAEQYGEVAQEMGVPFMASKPRTKREYFRCFYVNGVVHNLEKLPENDFRYKFMTGKRDQRNKCFYGIVRLMRDPQRFANKFLSQLMYMISTNSNGGAILNGRAFEDPEEVQRNWARPDMIFFTKDGESPRESVMPKPQVQYPQAMDKMLDFSVNSIRDTSGISPEMLGLVQRDQPGIVEAKRSDASYGILAPFFDSMAAYRRDHGKLLLKMMQTYLEDGTLIRVLGKSVQPQFIQLFREDIQGEFDVIAEEAPMSPAQKERAWMMIVQMMPILSKMQIPPQILVKLFKYSPLPTELVDEIEKAISQPNPEGEARKVIEALKTISEIQHNEAKSAQAESQAQKNLAETGLTNKRSMVEPELDIMESLSSVLPQLMGGQQQQNGLGNIFA